MDKPNESKWLCEECGWVGQNADLLKASNPFEHDDILVGCPQCRSANCIVRACDHLGCARAASCGTPTDAGYRHTCGEHRPEIGSKPGVKLNEQ